MGSHDKLNKLRAKSRDHLTGLFADAKFHDGKKQLLAMGKLRKIIEDKISGLSPKQLEDFLAKLAKDARKMKKLYRDVTK